MFTSAAQAGVLCEVAASAGRHLQVLRADGCSVSDAVLGALAAHCPSLRVLSLVGCRGVTDAGLAMLAAGCPRCDAEPADCWACVWVKWTKSLIPPAIRPAAGIL